MKIKITLITVLIFSVMLAGCKKQNDDNTNTTTTPEPTQAEATQQPTVTTAAQTTPGTDVVTTASIVNTNEAFLNAISKDGTWIICLLQDMTLDQELVMEGEFKNGKQDEAGNDLLQRKLALYSQDENRNITARYTLTAPKMTVSSPQASIQHGTFKGDLYIDVNDFQLVDTTVDGNVYFTKKEYQDSFQMDEGSKVTGTQQVQE